MKAEAFFHLTANFNYPLMCVLSVLMVPSMVIRYNMGWYEMLLIDVPLFFAATSSVCNFYMVCQRELHTRLAARASKYLPFLMSIGIGLSINNTRAVFEALFNKQSEFARTPKYRIEGDADEWVGKKYRQSVVVQPLIELALGLYFTATVFYALANGIYGTRAVPGAVPDRLPLHRPAVDRPAVRRRSRRRHRRARARPPGFMKARVAVLRVTPDTILSDIDRLVELAGVSTALAPRQDDDPQGQHLLALPVSRRPTRRRGSSKGTIQALARRGFTDQVCVQNKTVVTNAFKGEDLNHYVPIFKRYGIPVLLQLQGRGHDVGALQAEGADARARPASFPKASTSPTTSSARTSSTCRRPSATSTRRRPAR